eukprot:5358356-Prymnesium_polylepis.1
MSVGLEWAVGSGESHQTLSRLERRFRSTGLRIAVRPPPCDLDHRTRRAARDDVNQPHTPSSDRASVCGGTPELVSLYTSTLVLISPPQSARAAGKPLWYSHHHLRARGLLASPLFSIVVAVRVRALTSLAKDAAATADGVAK